MNSNESLGPLHPLSVLNSRRWHVEEMSSFGSIISASTNLYLSSRTMEEGVVAFPIKLFFVITMIYAL